MDRKSKFWRAKIFSKTLIGLEVAQLCWRVQPVIACICPSSSFTNSGKYKCKFTNTNLQIQANTNTNLQIQACLTLSACLEQRQVAECEQRPFKERFNVTLYKPQFFPLRLYARLYVWTLLPYSWKTKTNFSLKVKILVSWWLMSAKQGEKRQKGWNFMFNIVVTIFGHQGCHWHDQHGHQEVLLLCCVTMKMCDNEKGCQGRYSETSVLC